MRLLGLVLAFSSLPWVAAAQQVRTPSCEPTEQTWHTYAEVLSGQPGVSAYVRLFNPTGVPREVSVRTIQADTGESRQTSRIVPSMRSVVVPLWDLWPHTAVIVSVIAVWPAGSAGATTVTQWSGNHVAAVEKVPTVLCRLFAPDAY